MAFCPKILRGGGDVLIINLLKNECSFSSGDMFGGGDTQPLQDSKKQISALRGDGDIKTLCASTISITRSSASISTISISMLKGLKVILTFNPFDMLQQT